MAGKRKKSPHGEGTLYRKGPKKRKRGNWFVRFSAKGKPINLRTQDFQEARDRHLALIAEHKRANGIAVDHNLTLVQHLENWLVEQTVKAESRRSLKRSSLRRYKDFIRRYIEFLKATGREFLLLRDASAALVNAFLEYRVASTRCGKPGGVPISEAGANLEASFLCGLLNRASKKRLLPAVISSDVHMFNIAPVKTQLPNVLDIKDAVAQLDDEIMELFTRLIALTGMRSAEAMHLKWMDVDFDARVFHIRPESGEGGWTPKNTGSERDVPISNEVYDKLRELRASRREEPETAYVFMMPDGRPMKDNPDYPFRKLRKAIRTANRKRKKENRAPMPEFNYRMLRHFYISWSLSRAKNPIAEFELIKLVGHVDFQMIRTRYYHVDLEGTTGEKARNAAFFDTVPAASTASDASSVTPTDAESIESSSLPVDSRIRSQLHASTVQNMQTAALFDNDADDVGADGALDSDAIDNVAASDTSIPGAVDNADVGDAPDSGAGDNVTDPPLPADRTKPEETADRSAEAKTLSGDGSESTDAGGTPASGASGTSDPTTSPVIVKPLRHTPEAS